MILKCVSVSKGSDEVVFAQFVSYIKRDIVDKEVSISGLEFTPIVGESYSIEVKTSEKK